MSVTIDTSGLVNGETFEREEFIAPAEELKGHLEDMLNGILPFDGLLIGSGSLDPKAIAQANTTTKVALPPRMTSAQRLAIGAVPAGSFVYDTDVDGILVNDGFSWSVAGSSGIGRASVQAYSSGQGGSVNIAIPSDTNGYLVQWGAARFDTDEMHTDDNTFGAEDTRITFNTAGKYLITLQITMTAAAIGSVRAQIRLNGADIIASERILQSSGGFATQISIQTIYDFAEADYIEVIVTQNSGTVRFIDGLLSHFSACLQPASNTISLMDTFSTPESAPIASPRSADIGTWVFTQTDGQFSIV